MEKAKGTGWELRLGDWRDVLADVTRCEAVITDPPYSARTHAGQRTGSSIGSPTIDYGALIGASMAGGAPWWLLVFCDHAAFVDHERWAKEQGRTTFAPVIWHKQNHAPRFSGDGPTSAVEYICVSRQKNTPRDRMRSLPGIYHVKGNLDGAALIAGQKDLDGMRALIRDYSKPGDLIVDPYAGSGTTLLAAAMEGRRAIGAEIDAQTFAAAARRLGRGYTPQFDFAIQI